MQEGSVKYCGLVDCDTEEEFDTKLENYKEVWEALKASSKEEESVDSNRFENRFLYSSCL